MLFKDIGFDLFYIHIIDNLGSCVLLSVAVAKFFIIMVASIIYTPLYITQYIKFYCFPIYICVYLFLKTFCQISKG